MPKRNIPTNIENLVINNEPFEYAHLVKFERPFDPKNGQFRTDTNRYVYLTDGARDISYDGNIYRAHRLQSVGNYSETTVARATNMSLVLSGEDLGLSFNFRGSLSSSSLTAATSNHVDGSEVIDFVELGFREGDKVKLQLTSGSNFSNGDAHRTYIISSFSNNNQTITLAVTGSDSDDDALANISETNLTISLDNEELSGATLERGTNASDPLFTNREVFVYKIFFDADGVEKGALEIFKGIIASTSISESASASRVKWSLTSHWGDFVEVGGRLTLDEVHRALDADGKPSIDSAIKPIYATDLGFQHSETSLNTIANYKTTETRSIMKSKKRGGIAGAFGGKKYYTVEEEYEVDHEVDLNVHLKGRYLPVVYGVQRVPGIPVFADTKNNNSKEVYVAYALAEGKIQGLYNMYFENSSIICTDLNDSDVRNASNGTNRDSSQLQCYGRADRGDTLSGSSLTGALTTTANSSAYDYTNIQEDFIDGNIEGRSGIITIFDYTNVNEVNTPEAEALSNSKGLQTSETASILNPFNMKFTFYQGSSDQKADNNLVKIAEDNLFKIQNSYYESDQPYWSPNHRLLDTAYAVMKFTIGAEQTTIPEVEYVVRGKVLEAHNYDGTFVHDAVLGASDDATDFKNGDTCNVEVSTDGSTWITIEDDATPFVDGGTDKIFRILHNYSYFNSDGNEETRIRLDSVPNLNYGTDGSAGYTYVRLKSGSNYWHMITHNYGTVSTAASFPNLYKTPTSMSTNSSGVLTATFSSSDATALKANYGSNSFTYNLGGTLTGTAVAGLENMVLRGVWSSNTVTFRGTYTASQTITGVTVSTAGVYDLSSNSDVNAVTNAADINFENLEIVETGEQRQIIGFDTTNKYVTLSSPFTQAPTNSNTFTITGRGKDLRASNNPAIQTLDYITSKRYGKGLDTYTDINLASFKAAALLCDTRSDVTLKLASAASCVEGDMYKLVDTDGDHVASGLVQASTSSSTQVTFTRVSGKFLRQYYNYVRYKKGDYVISNSRVYEATTAGYLTKPTHSSGTVSNFKFISSVSLTKVTGSGPSSLSVVSDGTLPIYSLYDSDFIKYWRYLGWESHDQEWVTRHQTNFKLDTSKSIFANINALLSHYNGILSYSNGKYELNVETQANAETASVSNGVQSNPLHIENEDIIGNISLVDNTQKNSKNTIKASISDPQNNWGSRSVSFFNSNFLKADRNVVKTGTFPFTGITNYYNARINVEKELTQTRFSKEISFTVGQRGLLLKAGEVISITYPPFNFDNKRFRIENLTFNANCTVSIKAREYDDSIYVITPQRASLAHTAQTGANPALEKPSAPTSLTTSSTKPGTIEINWSNASNFSAESDYTELYRHTSDSRSNATLLATIADATTFSDIIGEAGTFYYWVRHKRNSNLTNTNKTLILEGDYNASAGVSGVAKLLSPSLEVDTASIQVKFNDSGVLTPSGSAQDIKVTATLKNITPNGSGVLFSLLDSDQTSQSDVQFTNGNTTLADTSSPYEATVDASTFSSSSTNKFVKVAVTDTSGEAFTSLIPVSVTKDGAAGAAGADGDDGNDGDPGLRTVQGYLFYEKTTSGAPGTPGSTTYRFSTGDIDGGSGATEVLALADTSAVNKWTNEPRTNSATSSNNFYTIRYSGTESSANSSTVTVSYSSSVVEQTSFTGVVVFNGGSLQDDQSNSITPLEASDVGSSGSTVIDGARISTGSVSSSNFSATSNDGSVFSTAGTRINLNNGSIASEEFRIDSSGNAAFKGDISAASGTLSNSIQIGSGQSVFKADSNGIYLGNETFADAEFSVTPAGVLKSTSATIGGEITATSLVVSENAEVHGDIRATSITAGKVTIDSINQEVWNEIDARTAPTQNGFYDEFSSTGTDGYYVGVAKNFDLLGPSNNGYTANSNKVTLRSGMVTGFSDTTSYTGTQLDVTFRYYYKLATSSTWISAGSADTTATGKYTVSGGFFYELDANPDAILSAGTLSSGSKYHFRISLTPAVSNNVWTDSAASPGFKVIYSLQQSSTGTGTGTGTVTSISGGDGITASPSSITTTGSLAVDSTVVRTSGTQTIAGDKTFSNDIIVSGNLDVRGTTTTLDTATLNVEDNNITLNYGTGNTTTTANGAGITIQDAVDGSNDATILWDATNDEFDFSHKVTAPALTIDNISINAEEIASTSNMTLNSGNDIILDADGGNVMLKDNSVWFGNFNHNGNNLAIDAKIQDGDIVFRGNDGGSTITALTLDMSDSGKALFNAGANFGNSIDVTGSITTDGLTLGGGTLSMSDTGNTSTISLTQKAGTQNSVATISANREDTSTSASRLFFSTNDGTSTLQRVRINSGGDVSFYEDTGTTAKFFWDASAESLCLGNTSAGASLDIRKDSGYAIRAENGSGHYFRVAAGGAIEVGGSAFVDASRNITSGTVQATSFSDGTISGVTFVDEDDMASNSATKIPTQQSVKAYVDSQPGTITSITNFADNRILTASGSTTINAETSLTFSGSVLHNIGSTTGGVPPILRVEDVGSSGKLGDLKHSAGTTTLISRNATSNGVIKFEGYNGTSTTTYGGFDASGNFEIGITDIIDASRNMLNIGTISSGTITTSNAMASSPYLHHFDVSGTNTNGGGAGIVFQTSASAGTTSVYGAKIQAVRTASSNGSADLEFYTSNANTSSGAHQLALTLDETQNATFAGKVTINEGDVADQLVIYRTSPSANQVGMKFDVHGVHSRFFGVGTDGHPYWSTTANLTGAGNGVWHSGLSNFKVGTVSVLTSSRNLQNIGTISSGAITSTSSITASSGGNVIQLGTDGNIEITRTSGGAYIDFKDSSSEDYDQRLQATSTGHSFSGTISSGAITTTGNLDIANKIRHIGDTDTYLSFADADDFRIVVGNSTRAAFNTSKIHFNQEGINQDFQVESNNSTHMLFVDASTDRVGISNDNPTADLSVGSTSTSSGDVHLRTTKTTFSITPSNTDAGGILLDLGWVSGGQGAMQFGIGGSEKARLDSSGNLLVGTQSVSNSGKITVDGGTNGNGIYAVTDASAGYSGAVIERSASDGDLIIFKKSTAVVGSIGTTSDALYISSPYGNDSGLRFVSGIIAPATTTGTNRDAAIDLGYSSGRFKDLYLSSRTIIGDGSNSAPAYTFGSDADTGMYRVSTNALAFATGGTERWRITSSGTLQGSGTISSGAITVNHSSTANVSLSPTSTGGVINARNSSGTSVVVMDGRGTPFIDVTGNLKTGGTTRIDSSGNLNNIGTVSTTHFQSLANVNGTGDGGVFIGNGKRLGFDQTGTRSWTMKAASGYFNLESGDGSGDLNLANSIGLRQNGTLVLDSSRNLTNIGTISSGAITSTGDIEVRSGNKLILQRPNNGIASNISTDSTGAMVLDSLNSEGFFFNNAGTNAFKLDPINATFAGTISSGEITTSGNVNINTANDGLYFSGGNNRIYFNNHRAMEGATDGSNLQIAEGYTTILAQADVHLGNGKEVRLYDADGSAYTGIKAKTATSSSGTYQLPASLPSNSGAVLISTTAGELSWSSNTVSTYTNGAIASNRVITSNGPSSIEAESNLTFDNETLLVNHATGKIQIGSTNAVQPEIIFKTGTSGFPRIKFDDGSVAAYIGYGHGSLQGEKLNISAPTIDIIGDLNLAEYIYHTGDTDTYIRIQDNSWTFRTGGGDRVIIDNSNVQITNNLTLGTPDDHVLMRLTDNSGAQFGFDPEYDHNLVITNEQGTTSQAMFLADTGDSGNDIWGVTRTIQGPTSGNTTGNEVWSKVLTLHGNGNLYTTGSIANEQFTIPNSAGSAGQVLKWPSSGTTLEWGSVSAGSSTTINNNANNRVITGSGTANTLEAEANFTYDGTNLDVTGNIRATGDVTAFHSSDARLKDNVTVIDSALNKVKQIRGVEFDWNDKQDAHEGHDIGVIAQEVEQVAPELVKDRQDGYKAVDYPKLTALLIEAVKELELKVKELEEKQK